jgi:hypothetical protein
MVPALWLGQELEGRAPMTTTPETPEPNVVVVQGLVVRPGDVLIVQWRGPLSLADVDRIRERIRERLPGLADVVPLGNTIGLAVYREGE